MTATRYCSCIHANDKRRLFFPTSGECPDKDRIIGGRSLNVDLLEWGDWGQTARAQARCTLPGPDSVAFELHATLILSPILFSTCSPSLSTYRL